MSVSEPAEHARSGPPQPPRVRPLLRVRRRELIGIVLLAILPLLACLGIFGPGTTEAQARNPVVQLSVHYPSDLRHGMRDRIEARVTNIGPRPLERVSLGFDSAYLRAFSDIAFTPEPDRAHQVELEGLQPGETRLVSIEIRAQDFGRQKGRIALLGAGAPVSVDLATLVFP